MKYNSKPPDAVDDEALFKQARQLFFSTLQYEFGAKRIQESVALEALLSRYERMEPPFHTQGSKEFPDAISLNEQ